MITKHLRLSIDFHITIADTPPLLPPGTIDPPDPEYDGRQARLLEAVKNNPQVLTRWMHELIESNMLGHGWTWWEEALTDGDIAYTEILAPVLETLPAEDREYFDEVARLDVFEECIDMFSQSFTVQEDPPVISRVVTEQEKQEAREMLESVQRAAVKKAQEEYLQKERASARALMDADRAARE